MDYVAIYKRLCDRGQIRPKPTSCERHHILPRCLGGGNDAGNITNLTPEEHYLAHQLLTRIYPNESKLVFAMVRMTVSSPYRSRSNNKLYGWVRRKAAAAMSKVHKGKPKTEEHRAKISASHMGMRPSPEALLAIRAAAIDPEIRARRSAGLIGKKKSLAHRASLSRARKGVPRPDISLRMKTFVRTPESNAKRSATQTGRKADPEMVARRNAIIRAGVARRKAEGLVYRNNQWVMPT